MAAQMAVEKAMLGGPSSSQATRKRCNSDCHPPVEALVVGIGWWRYLVNGGTEWIDIDKHGIDMDILGNHGLVMGYIYIYKFILYMMGIFTGSNDSQKVIRTSTYWDPNYIWSHCQLGNQAKPMAHLTSTVSSFLLLLLQILIWLWPAIHAVRIGSSRELKSVKQQKWTHRMTSNTP